MNVADSQRVASALEQLGYQAESGPWRNFYLSASKELRDGVLDLAAPKTVSPDTVRATPLDMFFDLLAVRLIGPKADGKTITLNANFTDVNERFCRISGYDRPELLGMAVSAVGASRTTPVECSSRKAARSKSGKAIAGFGPNAGSGQDG